MSDLTQLRDHARERATWQPGEPKAACRDRTSFGTPKPPDHANCGGGRCGCRCHEPTEAERHLWRQIAGEIEDYLAGPQPDLFGGESVEPRGDLTTTTESEEE